MKRGPKRFNPSQVGYKRGSSPSALIAARRFNPSQVGYKLAAVLAAALSRPEVSIPHR